MDMDFVIRTHCICCILVPNPSQTHFKSLAHFKSLYLLFKTEKLQNIIELAGGKCEIYNDQNLKKTKKNVYLFLNDTSGKHEHTQAKLQINLEKYKYNFKKACDFRLRK
jgi:hypothetical protein